MTPRKSLPAPARTFTPPAPTEPAGDLVRIEDIPDYLAAHGLRRGAACWPGWVDRYGEPHASTPHPILYVEPDSELASPGESPDDSHPEHPHDR